MSQIRVKDWTEKEIHKKKRGFNTKKEALQRERNFINQSSGSLGMSFMDFIELYIQDMEKRLKPSTVANKRFLIDLKIIPTLGSSHWTQLNQPTFANGSMGKKNADEMALWPKDEFSTFIEAMKERPASYAIFMTMYYIGIHEGELLALTPADIDFDKDTLTINKSYQRLEGKDMITPPKTPKSNRVVMLPEVLKTVLHDYMENVMDYSLLTDCFRITKVSSIVRCSTELSHPV